MLKKACIDDAKDDIWVVTKRGSIKTLEDFEGLEHPEWMAGDVTLQFEAFDDASACMREMVRMFATCPSNVFDGEGGIHGLSRFFDRIQEWLDDHGPINEHRKIYSIGCKTPDFSYMGGDYNQARNVPDWLKDLLLEQTVPSGGFPQFRWTDWMAAIDSKADSLKVLYAAPTPPLDGYNPNIEVRGFAESDPEIERVLHIYNELGQDPKFVGSLDVRLWKTTEDDLDDDLERLADQLDAGYENGVGFGPSRKIPGIVVCDGVRIETNGRFIPDDIANEEQIACYKRFVEHVVDMAENKGFLVDRRYWVPDVFIHPDKVKEEYGDREYDVVEESIWNSKHSTRGSSRVHCYILSGDSTMIDFEINIALNTGNMNKQEAPFVIKRNFAETCCNNETGIIEEISCVLDQILEDKDKPSIDMDRKKYDHFLISILL